MLLSIILQAGLGKALFGIAAAIAAFAAAFGISKIGKAAIDAGARQPEFTGKYQMMAIIVGASWKVLVFSQYWFVFSAFLNNESRYS